MERLGAFLGGWMVEDKLVLELGCGQGDFAIWLLDQGARVFGIDISEFNIDRCREKAYARNIDPARYTFSVMNAHQTIFPTNILTGWWGTEYCITWICRPP